MYTSIADRRSGIWMPELCLLYPATGSRAFSLLMSYSRYTVKSEAHKSKGRDRYGFKAYTVGTAGGQLECEEYSYWLTRFSEATLTMNVIPDSKTPPSRTWGPCVRAVGRRSAVCPTNGAAAEPPQGNPIDRQSAPECLVVRATHALALAAGHQPRVWESTTHGLSLGRSPQAWRASRAR